MRLINEANVHQNEKLKNAIFQMVNSPTPNMADLRQTLKEHYTKELNDGMWLISTDNCQLCETAIADYHAVERLTACVPAHIIDVLDFDETMSAVLAPFVPILINQKDLLTYPFGVLDIVQLNSL